MFSEFKSMWDVVFNEKRIHDHCVQFAKIEPKEVWFNTLKLLIIYEHLKYEEKQHNEEIIGTKSTLLRELHSHYQQLRHHSFRRFIAVGETNYVVIINYSIRFNMSTKPIRFLVDELFDITVQIVKVGGGVLLTIKPPNFSINHTFTEDSVLMELESHYSLYNQYVSGKEYDIIKEIFHVNDYSRIPRDAWCEMLPSILLYNPEFMTLHNRKFHYNVVVDATFSNFKPLTDDKNCPLYMGIIKQYMPNDDYTRLENLMKLKGNHE